MPLSMYATGATIGNGQPIVHLLPMLLTGLLLLHRGQCRWRDDLLAAAPVLVALVKPSVSVPFFWIVFFVPGRLRPAARLSFGKWVGCLSWPTGQVAHRRSLSRSPPDGEGRLKRRAPMFLKSGMKIIMQIISRPKGTSYLASFLVAVSVFLISAIVFSQYGFEGTLSRDSANALYSGQQMARGIPHYVSIFNHSGPLAPLISGVSVSVATLFNFNDVLTVRITFFILGSLAVVGLYLLGSTLFESRQVGLLAAFVFTGFRCFGNLTTSGPCTKTPMVLFEILSLLLTARKKWFWAGICGSLAFLAWQPTAIYPLLTILLAITQSEQRRQRTRNVIRVVSGASIPIIIVSIYFVYKDAFYEFIDGLILFNIKHLERPLSSPFYHTIAPFNAVYLGYTVMAIPIFLGFLVVCLTYIWRIKLYGGSIPRLLSEDRFAAFLLSFPAPVIWSVLDFQGYPDFYVFLPYVAIGFGWLLYLALHGLMAIEEFEPTVQRVCFLALCTTLAGSASANYRLTTENGLQEQRQWAQQIEFQFGRDSKLVSIGVPEILVLLHRTNPNPYVFILSGIDNRIEANTPGGFDGWLEELERYDPSVIAFGPTEGRFKSKLMIWLQTHYQETTVGSWTLFVKRGSND